MPFKNSFIGKALWALGDTVKGKTKTGQFLHQVLPAKKARSLIGEIIKGTKAISPVPEIKSPEIRQNVENAIPELKRISDKSTSKEEMQRVIGDVLDLLDDGMVNGSKDYDDLSPEWRKRINVAWQIILVAIGAYQVYANWDQVIHWLGF